jgi:fucose permease
MKPIPANDLKKDSPRVVTAAANSHLSAFEQDVRRLQPDHAARFMGLLTAIYGIGEIVGPPLAAYLLRVSAGPGEVFARALGAASATPVIGAGLYLVMRLCWPINK